MWKDSTVTISTDSRSDEQLNTRQDKPVGQAVLRLAVSFVNTSMHEKESDMNEKDLTAFCGLYCGDCPRFQARFSDLAGDLLTEFERLRFAEFSRIVQAHVKEFENYDAAVSLLTVLQQIKCEAPCRSGGDGCPEACGIKACTAGQGLAGCWDCSDFETCEKLDFLKSFCGDAPVKNLRTIKANGIEGWARHRAKQYPWQ